MDSPKDIEAAPQVTLERAIGRDVETYLNIERSVAGNRTYSAMTDEVEALQHIEKSKVFFIKEAGRIVGSVSYVMKDPDHAYIDGLAIMPEYQHRGIDKRAMQRMLEMLKDIKHVDLVTHPENEYAIRLYQALGFSLGEVKENYFGDGEPRVEMHLDR